MIVAARRQLSVNKEPRRQTAEIAGARRAHDHPELLAEMLSGIHAKPFNVHDTNTNIQHLTKLTRHKRAKTKTRTLWHSHFEEVKGWENEICKF